MVYQCLKKYEIELSEIAYNDFVEHIYDAMRRIRQEKYVESQAADMLGRKEKQFVEELTNRWERIIRFVFLRMRRII